MRFGLAAGHEQSAPCAASLGDETQYDTPLTWHRAVWIRKSLWKGAYSGTTVEDSLKNRKS